jgi:MFS family permease
MKLNYKRTLLVGFAFFLICAFWQAYDTIIPKILTDKFGLSQSVSGAVMAVDNLLALFLLPWFGAISDRTNTRIGKRKPFVIVGTIIACVAFLLLSFADNAQLNNLGEISRDNRAALEVLYDAKPEIEIIPEGSAEKTPLSQLVSREEFTSVFELKGIDENLYKERYTSFVVPARQVYASRVTSANPTPFVAFAIILMIVLVAMGTFRSPAVALMPDVTPKPLRSKANAIINLMGAVGGIIVLVLGIVFGTGKNENLLMSYTSFFAVIIGIMLAALAAFALTVKEPKWACEALACDGEA